MSASKAHNIVNNKDRSKLASEISDIGFYDWYPQEDKIFWDENLYRITGLDPESKTPRQQYFMSTIHPEDVERVAKDMEDILNPTISANSFDNNFRAMVDGHVRYMRTAGVRTFDKSGQVSEVYGMVMDTTLKVESEQKISENEERLRIAASATGFGTFDWLLPENKLYWDARMREMFGLKEETNVDLNTHFFEHIHPEDQQRVAKNFEGRMSSKSDEKSFFYEFRIIVNGELKYITSHGSIVRDGKKNVLRVTGTLFDITRIKNTERELQESQEYFRSIFEGNPDHIFTVNKKKEIVFINHVAPGLTREEVIGTPILDLVEASDRKMVSKVIDRVFTQGIDEHYETTFPGPDGIIYYSTRVGPLVENDLVFGATFISRDITSTRQSEQKLKQQAIELQRTNQNLEQFAYVSSHDIKAPITNLQSLVKMMEEEQVISEEGRVLFDRLKSTVDQMNQTNQSLNEVFSIQNDLKLPKEKLDLQTTLLAVLESINNQIEDSNAVISYSFEKAPFVHFPQTHLKSIFQNLITNSIKYKQPEKAPEISITSKKIGGRVQLLVSDNGRGIDLDKYGKKIFGLFQRFHLDIEGKGMGLHIIQLIVESYGGEISVKSTPDKGSQFLLIL